MLAFEGHGVGSLSFVSSHLHRGAVCFCAATRAQDEAAAARLESTCAARGRQVQRTMLELLNQLDGFEATNQIKVIMATNRRDREIRMHTCIRISVSLMLCARTTCIHMMHA